MEKLLLFTPGPVNVAKNVKEAICKEDICHREAEFDALLQSVENKLLQLFEIKTISDYRAVVITGSGTAANESMMSSIIGDQNILILSNGEFGERLHKISKIHNKNTFLLDFAWGEKLDLEKVEAYLQEHDIDIVAMVHHETSSGMLNPLEKIGALSKENGAMLIVDCVSSTGAEVINMEKCHISFCSSSSSKAVCSYSGLSFVVGRIDEFEKLKDMPVKSTYLNLYNFYNFIKTYSQTPNTPAVPLFFALEQTLINILDKGIYNYHAGLRDRASILRQGMLKLGLEFLIDEKDMCCVLTTVKIPFHIDVTAFRQKLRKKSIIIYEGKGCFKDKVFQVGNIGELSFDDIQFFLKSLKEILRSFGPVNIKNVTSINFPRSILTSVNENVERKNFASQYKT
ncbi:MAG: alanine--glyoxylate aminotransferase family protein [Alphaproteobacteria bacterium]|nr:alanine--glyoxylate aminotransferase family protein [Alphaproteobacteria bacterium]